MKSPLFRMMIDEGACPDCGGDVGRESEMCLNRTCPSRARHDKIDRIISLFVLIVLFLASIFSVSMCIYRS